MAATLEAGEIGEMISIYERGGPGVPCQKFNIASSTRLSPLLVFVYKKKSPKSPKSPSEVSA